MPYSGGTFTNVAGATTALPGQTVQSAVWDNIHTDYATALTMVMSQLISNITNRNAICMNGGLEVWQRGAGGSASIAQAASLNLYTADRWYLITGANQASVVSAAAGLVNGSQLSGKVLRNNGQTGTTAMTFGYPLTTDEVTRLIGSKVSLTITVKAGANWSPTSGTLTIYFSTGLGSPAKLAAFTTATSLISSANNLTPGGAATTIQVSSSVVVPALSTQGEVGITWTPVGTASADDSITIDDVQVEAQLSGSTWTPTNYDRISFWDMYTSCQRHYTKTFLYGTAPGQAAGLAGAPGVVSQGNLKIGTWYQYPVRLRGTPSITVYNPVVASASWQEVTTSASITATIDPSTAIGDDGVFISGATVGATDRLIYIHLTASAGIA